MVKRNGNSAAARAARAVAVSSYIGAGIVPPNQGGGVTPPIPPNAVRNEQGGYVLNSAGGYVLKEAA